MILLTPDPIDVAAIRQVLEDERAGGEVLFTGTVRNQNEGRKVVHLTFEAFDEMAVAQMGAIADEIRARWDVTHVAMVHRTGLVAINEICVVIGVSAPHRAAAFEACRYGIDRLKQDVPIWKRETYEDGESWLSNHP